MDQAVPVNSPTESSPAEKPWVEVYGSRGLPDWLARQRAGAGFHHVPDR